MEKQLIKLIDENDGIITTKQAKEAGIPSIYLTKLVRQGKIERIRNGVYLDTNKIGDEYYLFQIRFPNAIFSHNTVLYFHNFTERTPSKIDVTVYRGYNPHAFPNNIKVHYSTINNHDLGIETMKSPQGKDVLCYDLERTICDIIKNNTSLDSETRNKSLRNYFNSGRMNEEKLYSYARQLKCIKKLELIVEIM